MSRSADRRVRPRLVRGIAAVVLALVGLVGAGAAPASAHAQLVGSNPADGAELDRAPAVARIDLSQNVFPEETTLVLTDTAGHRTTLGGVTVQATARLGTPDLLIPRAGQAGSATTVTVPLPPLGPGVYRLAWRTLSADDLHVTSGVLVFGVRQAVGRRAAQVDDPLPPAGQTASRWVAFAAPALACGAAWLALLAPGLTGTGRRAARAAALGCLTGAAAEGLRLLLQTGGARSPALVLRVLSSPAFGPAWAAREAVAVVAATVCLALSRRELRRRGRAVLLAVTSAAVAVDAAVASSDGHARTLGGALALWVTAAHLFAAAWWLGTVVALLAVVRRPAPADGRREALRRVGIVSAACLVVMVASGTLLAGVGTASLDAALLSTYGRLVAAKVAVLVLVLGCAAVTTVVLHRRGVPGRRVLAVEAALLAVAALLGTAVSQARPAVGVEWTPASAASPLAATTVGDLVETVRLSPNRPGQNFLSVDVFQTRRPEPGPVTAVVVRAAGPARDPVTVTLRPDAAGRWLLPTDVVDAPGNWTFTVHVERAGLPASEASLGWFVPDPAGRLRAPVVDASPWRTPLRLAAAVLVVVGLLGWGAAVWFGPLRRSVPGAALPASPGTAVDPDLADGRVPVTGVGRRTDAPDDDPGDGEADGLGQRWRSQDGSVAVR